AEIAAALKAQNRPRLSALRMISAALQERDLAARSPLADAEIPPLLRKMIRQRRESQALYAKAGRADQAEAEGRGITLTEESLPRQLSDAEVREQVAAVVAEVGAVRGEIGRVMGLLKARYSGRMDFAKASAIVKELLA